MFLELKDSQLLNVVFLQDVMQSEVNPTDLIYYMTNAEYVREVFDTELEAIARLQAVKDLILLPWCNCSGGSSSGGTTTTNAEWGKITGDITSQADLMFLLNQKIEDAPSDTRMYVRQDGEWVVLDLSSTGTGSSGIEDVPDDGKQYVRVHGEWKELSSFELAPSDDKLYGMKNGVWVEISTTTTVDGIEDAPTDGGKYVRQDGEWVLSDTFVDAPLDGKQYVRQNGNWVEIVIEGGTSTETTTVVASNGIKYSLLPQVNDITLVYTIDENITEELSTGVFYNGLLLNEVIDYTIDYTAHTLTTTSVLKVEESVSFILIVGGLTGVAGASFGIEEAPTDGKSYVRQNGNWVEDEFIEVEEETLLNIFKFDGVTATFSIEDTDITETSKIYINGLRQINTLDYEIIGNEIKFMEVWTEEDSCLIEV